MRRTSLTRFLISVAPVTGEQRWEGEIFEFPGRADPGIHPDEATRWIKGLDRLHTTRRIQRCFDLSATPFAPTGKTTKEEGLFEWIVSDFNLNDAIEASVVKTPRLVVHYGELPDTKIRRPKLCYL